MAVYLIAFLLFGMAVLGMGVGVLVGRTRITGSCGGLKHLPGVVLDCGACPDPCEPEGSRQRNTPHAVDHSPCDRRQTGTMS